MITIRDLLNDLATDLADAGSELESDAFLEKREELIDACLFFIKQRIVG